MIEIATEEMTAGIRDCWKKSFTLDDPRYFEHFFRYILVKNDDFLAVFWLC